MLQGSQVARFNTAPAPLGYSIEHAVNALELAEGYGLTADAWQAEVVRAWLRTTGEGLWVASTWGLSVPRQNGKNGSLEVVELYMMVALGLKILHTSHLLGSARKAFKRLMHFFGTKVNDPHAKFPELNALVKEIRKTNGQEAIELHNGGLIELGARTGGAGRGSSFDVLVVDEAQQYEEDEQEALEPTTSASPSGDPVTIFLGTPPRDTGERGAPFVRVRDGAVTGQSKRTSWVEHSPEGDVDAMTEPELIAFVAKRQHWAESNPAAPHRIKWATIEAEHERMSPRSFARERLNMWPTPAVGGCPIPKDKWKGQKLDEDDLPDDVRPCSIGLDMNLERTKVTISVGVFVEDGICVDIAADAPFDEAGTSALVEWLWERCKRRVPIVIDAFSPARSLQPHLVKRGMKVFILRTDEMVQACANFFDGVMRDKNLFHLGNGRLTSSLEGSVKDVLNKSGAWKWNRIDFSVDLGPLISATCAHFGAIKFARRRRSSEAASAGSTTSFMV